MLAYGLNHHGQNQVRGRRRCEVAGFALYQQFSTTIDMTSRYEAHLSSNVLVEIIIISAEALISISTHVYYIEHKNCAERLVT